jgi:hypothetical protein
MGFQSSTRKSSLLVISVLILLGSLSAQSVSWAHAPSEEEKKRSDEFLVQGIEQRRKGDEVKALELIQKAYKLNPIPRHAGQLALVEQALHRWIDADKHLREALSSGTSPWVKKNRDVLEKAALVIDQHLGQIDIKTDVPQSELWVTGTRVGVIGDKPLRIYAGKVQLEIRAKGYVTKLVMVQIPPGKNTEIQVTLDKQEEHSVVPVPSSSSTAPPTTSTTTPTPPPSSSWTGRKTVGVISLGVGAVGFGVATIFGIQSLNKLSEYKDLCPTSNTCSDVNKGTSLYNDGRQAGLIANIGIGVGVIGVGVGVYLLLTGGSSENTKTSAHQPAKPSPVPHVDVQTSRSFQGATLRWAWLVLNIVSPITHLPIAFLRLIQVGRRVAADFNPRSTAMQKVQEHRFQLPGCW